MTQLYSFTGLKIVQNNTQTQQNETIHDKVNPKQIQQKNVALQKAKILEPKIPQKERNNRKMTEKILPQDQQQKFEHINSSRLRSQPQKIIKHSSHNLKY